MEIASEILSDITVHMKYAKYLPEQQRRENWVELCTRNRDMHIKKYPELKKRLPKCMKTLSYQRRFYLHMRSMQFAGNQLKLPQIVYITALYANRSP